MCDFSLAEMPEFFDWPPDRVMAAPSYTWMSWAHGLCVVVGHFSNHHGCFVHWIEGPLGTRTSHEYNSRDEHYIDAVHVKSPRADDWITALRRAYGRTVGS